MVAQLFPAAIEPKAADAGFWARYHEFRRLRGAAARPEDDLRSDAEEEAILKRGSPFRLQDRYEISTGGRMISVFEGHAVAPESPEFETSKHLYDVDLYVIPERRRERIGASWLPRIVERLDARGCTTAGFWCEEESGHAFMRWVGAERKFESIESRLDLAEVDWRMLEGWLAEGQSRSPSTRLEIHDGGPPEAMWDEFTMRLSALLNTMPFESLDHGDIVVTPAKMRDYFERMKITGEVVHTALTREPDGVISGITEISWVPYRRRNLYQMFTGVDPAQRGRGLGKWIKAALLLHARNLYPDARWVTTDNAGSNAPMLKINRTMGFRPHRRGATYQVTRDRLAARARAL
jgi:GNAT superfamily N-acetyltransferase